ncbi:hypothetical protein D3C76_1300210 [compost metagenome]
MAQIAQLMHEQNAVGRIVIHHQHLERLHPASVFPAPTWHVAGSRRWQAGQAQLQLDARTNTDAAVELHAPAHQLAQHPADAQPQPRTIAPRLPVVAGLAIGCAQACQVGHGNADAGIFHHQGDRDPVALPLSFQANPH